MACKDRLWPLRDGRWGFVQDGMLYGAWDTPEEAARELLDMRAAPPLEDDDDETEAAE